MSRRPERAWVGVLDSTAWRKLAGSGPGRSLLRSAPMRRIDTWRRRRWAALQGRRSPDLFADVRTCCLFLGSVKSGASLLGAMLDAHPEVVLADEVDVLGLADAGFDRAQAFHVLAREARREMMKGRVTARRLSPYSLAIPGQWQGRHRGARIVGASRAGPTTRRLGTDPDALARLRHWAGDLRLAFVHVVRNPYDPISATVVRGRRHPDEAIADYVDQCERALRLRARIPRSDVHEIAYEDVLADPRQQLSELCEFLGADVDEHHLAACAELIARDHPAERELIEWTPDRIAHVQREIGRFDFLSRYVDAAPPTVGAR